MESHKFPFFISQELRLMVSSLWLERYSHLLKDNHNYLKIFFQNRTWTIFHSDVPEKEGCLLISLDPKGTGPQEFPKCFQFNGEGQVMRKKGASLFTLKNQFKREVFSWPMSCQQFFQLFSSWNWQFHYLVQKENRGKIYRNTTD